MFKKAHLTPDPDSIEEEEEAATGGNIASDRPKPDPPGDSCPGCSSKTKVPACYHIKDLHPKIKDGFFWVKPGCSKSPLRVYCDFKTKWE